MPRLVHRNPAYRRHRSSGQAVVTLDGRDHYLGLHGTKASRAEYDRLVGEWLAGGRRLVSVTSDLQVVELIRAFWGHAEGYYRKPDGSCSSEVKNFRDALRPLKRLYGNTPVADFGPLRLKSLREEMIRLGWCRTHINRQVGRIKHVFKWGTENEMVSADVFHALQAVGGLKVGRSGARESETVVPVDEQHVQATLRFVSRQVAAMIQLQLVTGMRPGEACSMRGCDLDTAGPLWVYRPTQHKTRHHGHDRRIYLGPKAQEILQPFLKPDVTAYLFSPADAERERRERMHAKRKTPLSCGNKPGSNVKRKPKRAPGVRYTVESYHQRIRKACDKADAWAKGGKVVANDERIVPPWHPHQLRHNAATWLRRQYGLEAAQVILGHRTLSVTEIYAERNVAAAQKIMGEVG